MHLLELQSVHGSTWFMSLCTKISVSPRWCASLAIQNAHSTEAIAS